MTRITEISKEDMEPIVTSRTKAIESASVAEKALKDARLAELEFKVQIQQLYLAKGLDPNCKVDISTGVVSWPGDPEPETVSVISETSEPKKKRGRKPAGIKPDSEGE